MGIDDQNPIFETLMQLGSVAVGMTVGGDTGASVALSATQNNYLTHRQIEAMRAELKTCRNASECDAIRQKYRSLSVAQDAAMLSVCTANPMSANCVSRVLDAAAYRNQWTDVSKLGLSDDLARSSRILWGFVGTTPGQSYRGLVFEGGGIKGVPILPVEHTIAAASAWAEGVGKAADKYGVFSREVAGEFGLGALQVAASRFGVAKPVYSMTGSWGKGDKLPNSSMKYENPGHHDTKGGNANSYDPTKSVLPANHQQLWNQSHPDPVYSKTRWAKEGNGKSAIYHRFQDDGNGNWHWNGSTDGKSASGKPRRIPIDKVPNQIKKSSFP